MPLKTYPIKYLDYINRGAKIKAYSYSGVIKYTIAGMLLGLMLVVNALLLNYQSGFKGPWFHIFDYSPDFAVIILSPLILSILFCYIGIRHEQLVLFNNQIKDNLSHEKLISSVSDLQVQLLAKVVAQINEAVIISDKDGVIQWVNDGFTNITGYKLNEVQNKTAASFLYGPLTDKMVIKRIAENLFKGEAIVEELINYKKNGSSYWTRESIKNIQNDIGETTHFISIHNDITNRKERELAIECLYKEVADYKFALDQSAIVIIFNTAGKLVHVNKQFCTINGLEEADIIGKDYRSISLSMRDKNVMAPIWEKLATGKMWKGELINRNHNGKSYWAETTIVPLLDVNEKPHQFLAIQTDITVRKELENELVNNKNKLELAMQVAQIGAWEITTDSTLYLSKELRKIYHFPLNGDISLEELFSKMHPDDVSFMRNRMHLVSGAQELAEVEFRFIIDGKLRYMTSNISPRVNEQGMLVGSFGTAKDITQRKLTELALKKSEEEKAVVLNNAQTMICIHDMDGKIIDVNTAGEKMSGFTKEEVIGINFKVLISPEFQNHFENYITEITTKRSASGSLQIINKAGKKRVWLYQNAVYENTGSTPYIIASAIDITESVKAQNEIEKQRQFTRQIIDNSPNVIFVLNDQYQIVLSNKTFCEYYSYKNELPFASELSKGEQDIFLGDYLSMMDMEEGEIIRLEGSMENQENGNVPSWFNIIKKCFKEKNGKKYILGFGMDITSRYQIETDLIAANEMVERSMKVKDQFISNMSHEIRTPLNAVIGFTDLLAQTTLNLEQAEYIEIVKTASQNLLALINNILDLSKIESSNISLENLPIDIKQIVKSAAKIVEPKAKTKGVEIICDISPNIPEKLLGDQLRLSQILFNLLDNAVKFTDEGYVEIACKMVNGSDSKKQYISFTVKDTGIGVAEEKQHDIYERFTQANSDTQRLYGGTGLGLNITKGIVDMFGGKLTLESVPGKGSSFHFILPFNKFENADSFGESVIDVFYNLPAVNANPIHVLLAEDNMINAMLAKKVLQNGGFTVDHVVNGALALQKLQEQPYDVVLMDIQMPVMNGILATKNIRQLPGVLANIPIVAMTAHSLYGEMQNCYKAGMTGYVSKPFKPENLFSAIRDAIKVYPENKESTFSFPY